MTDELAVLLEIRDLLRTALAARRPSMLSAEVDEHLRVIAGVVEDRLFSVNELMEFAGLAEGEELRAAIAGLAGSFNGRRLGKALRRLEGKELAGLRVERIGVDRLGVIWTVRVCGNENRKPAAAVDLRARREGG